MIKFLIQLSYKHIAGFLFSGFILLNSLAQANCMELIGEPVVAKTNAVSSFVEDEEMNSFLLRAANNRLVCIKEGNSAVERGNSPMIRDYGRKMIKDHNSLLVKIRRLAQGRSVSLNSQIGEEQKRELTELQGASGEDFDRKFVAVMIADHERDLREFRKAVEIKDIDISDFALKYLPIIQSHLDEIKNIKKTL